MIYSVYRHDSRDFAYYEAPGKVPPHGWFRAAYPGGLRRPEEIASRLPAGASLVGTGPLPKGVIATDFPGVGTLDTDRVGGSRETGLAGIAVEGSPSSSRGVPHFDPWEQP